MQRIFVNAAIKKALCREAKGDRSWLHKVRPMYGHDYHFHIRIKCPPGSGECESQPAPSASEGCSAGDLAFWFKDFDYPPEAAERAAEAAAADDHGAIAGRLPPGSGRAGCEAVAASASLCSAADNAVSLQARDVRTDRKSSGLPERRFRLSHSIITDA